jgi:16S rRNA (adenine1518-N6/adenine1519-N6)-dimethyltransferase
VSLNRQQTLSLLADAGIQPKRKYGQNFLVDQNSLDRIVRLANVNQGDHVLEIGAGLGALTETLLSVGAVVTSLEVDPDLVTILRQRTALDHATIVEGDALTIDLNVVAPPHEGPWSVVANLPYNVATPVVLRCLEEAPQMTTLFVMVQAEVGQRLAAGPGDKAYGAPSLRVAYHATASVVGRVPASVFVPQPKVESVLVSMKRSAAPAVDPDDASEEDIFRLVRQSFSQRRKMLRKSLAKFVNDDTFQIAEVDPTARPEELDVVAFGRLAKALR